MVDNKGVEKAVFDLLKALGEDVNREGLCGTPKRVAKMYEELLSGKSEDPCKYLKFFNEDIYNSEIVIVKDIKLNSICEHHLLPFVGTANIAYIPKDGKILGLSKFARIVNSFSKRLQVQERLTDQIAKFIYEKANAKGVIVIIEAEHMCMTIRGIKSVGAKTKTSVFYGVLKEDLTKRKEALSMMESRV